MSRLKDQLVDIVTTVARVDVAQSPEEESGSRAETGAAASYAANPTLIIGSSTGGPKMVERVLSELPLDADLRILVVQHMPEGFTGRFAERIDARSAYDVREAVDGARIGGGEALVAAGDSHMRVKNYRNGRLRVTLTDDPPVNSVRPAVDVTMETAAAVIDDALVGVILTGMGEDGADGICRIKETGGHTLAQDEATSAVFGMPKRAVETGCIDSVLPIGDVSAGVVDAITREVT